VESSLETCQKELLQSREYLERAQRHVSALEEQERKAQEEMALIKATCITREESDRLKQAMNECKRSEMELSKRYEALSDDFCHLMERRDKVDAELAQQQKWRRRVLALHQGLEHTMNSLRQLEQKCCEVFVHNMHSLS
jgi:chromosome segregation ATPase